MLPIAGSFVGGLALAALGSFMPPSPGSLALYGLGLFMVLMAVQAMVRW